MKQSSATRSDSREPKRREGVPSDRSKKIGDPRKGGVSDSLKFIHDCVTRGENHKDRIGRDSLKAAALGEVADLLRLAFQQALRGDKECGYFFAELAPVLYKRRDRLAEANATFRKHAAKVESSRPETKRSSALRSLIREIIADTGAEIHALGVANAMAKKRRIRKRSVESLNLNRALAILPNLDPSPDVVAKWTDDVVYPALRRMAEEGQLSQEITDMKKATDENGKFQISNLKPQIRDTVKREASLLRLYYFDL